MAEIPKVAKVRLELESGVAEQIKQLIRDELALHEAAVLEAAVARRDGTWYGRGNDS